MGGDAFSVPFIGRIADAMRPHLFVADKPPAVIRTELGDLSGAVGAAIRAQG